MYIQTHRLCRRTHRRRREQLMQARERRGATDGWCGLAAVVWTFRRLRGHRSQQRQSTVGHGQRRARLPRREQRVQCGRGVRSDRTHNLSTRHTRHRHQCVHGARPHQRRTA